MASEISPRGRLWAACALLVLALLIGWWMNAGPVNWLAVQSLVLLVTVIVAGWYAMETRKANAIAQKALGDAQSSHIYVWSGAVKYLFGDMSLELVIENSGPGIAENVMLFPLLRQEWDSEAPRRFLLDYATELSEDLRDEDRKNRMWYRPMLRPDERVHCLSFGIDREDSVVCVAWDDSWRGQQFRCYRIALEGESIDETFYLVGINGPHGHPESGVGGPCTDMCPVFRKLNGVGPHEWRRTDPKAYEAAMHGEYYRAQW